MPSCCTDMILLVLSYLCLFIFRSYPPKLEHLSSFLKSIHQYKTVSYEDLCGRELSIPNLSGDSLVYLYACHSPLPNIAYMSGGIGS